jgi:hypothetical protein
MERQKVAATTDRRAQKKWVLPTSCFNAARNNGACEKHPQTKKDWLADRQPTHPSRTPPRVKFSLEKSLITAKMFKKTGSGWISAINPS